MIWIVGAVCLAGGFLFGVVFGIFLLYAALIGDTPQPGETEE